MLSCGCCCPFQCKMRVISYTVLIPFCPKKAAPLLINIMVVEVADPLPFPLPSRIRLFESLTFRNFYRRDRNEFQNALVIQIGPDNYYAIRGRIKDCIFGTILLAFPLNASIASTAEVTFFPEDHGVAIKVFSQEKMRDHIGGIEFSAVLTCFVSVIYHSAVPRGECLERN